MHKNSISIIHQPLIMSPDSFWQMWGYVIYFNRELKRTIIHVEVIDYTKTEDNVNTFELTLMGEMKTEADRTLSMGDLIVAIGELKSITISNIEFHVKYFRAWNGMKNSFTETKVVPGPVILDPTLAY